MNTQRLLALAEHLETGKLGHEVFDFRHVNAVPVKGQGLALLSTDGLIQATGGVCGTHGCAIGELPIVFPESWYFQENGLPRLKVEYVTKFAGTGRDVIEFFGVSYGELCGLFYDGKRECPWNKHKLGTQPSRAEVAAGIRRYVVWRGGAGCR